jgi:hypothetical protein
VTYASSDETALPTGPQQTAFAGCPEGMVVTGGGVFTPSTSTAVTVQKTTWASSGDAPDAWGATVNNTSGIDTTFFVDAICVRPTSVGFAGFTSAARALHAVGAK